MEWWGLTPKHFFIFFITDWDVNSDTGYTITRFSLGYKLFSMFFLRVTFIKIPNDYVFMI